MPGVDAELSSAILVPQARAASKPARWEEVGAGYVRMYAESIKVYLPAFGGIRVEDLATSREAIERAMTELQKKDSLQGWNDTPDERKAYFRGLMGCALAVAAANRGFSAHTEPGWPVTMRGPRGDFNPFDVVHRMDEGDPSDEAWRALCADLGLEGAVLGQPS